jgi:hypothetical protein
MRVIDADRLSVAIHENVSTPYEDAREAKEDCLREIEESPTVDAEVVVRCKDCKHSTLPSELTQRYGVPGTLTCHNRHSPCNRRNVGGDDFCSYGERKDKADAEG